ncbi:hypothetical protein CAter282_3745 [Collimonas arenae]|uniref:Uncharacterized protein n=1 Tax=Collimonas arenae TaxID=279058 RepID=A0A127QN00_9BURK|nr:hypothetical protein CAter10_4092 [Collimonas arenae]AMP11423.1 hypothetical protein CAter282_3745 [Collimonas arenae]
MFGVRFLAFVCEHFVFHHLILLYQVARPHRLLCLSPAW